MQTWADFEPLPRAARESRATCYFKLPLAITSPNLFPCQLSQGLFSLHDVSSFKPGCCCVWIVNITPPPCWDIQTSPASAIWICQATADPTRDLSCHSPLTPLFNLPRDRSFLCRSRVGSTSDPRKLEVCTEVPPFPQHSSSSQKPAFSTTSPGSNRIRYSRSCEHLTEPGDAATPFPQDGSGKGSETSPCQGLIDVVMWVLNFFLL